MLFVTGYLLEWSLSVDNIFVIALIFAYLKIPALYQYRVLFWGIVGAIVLRGMMIVTGAALLQPLRLDVLRVRRDPAGLGAAHAARRRRGARLRLELPGAAGAPLHAGDGGPATGRASSCAATGRLHATPLFVALVMVELTDVVFAVDSIPAILAVTRDPFIVFTSNAFAILGLRSLYFAVAGLMAMFRYLKYSLVLILAFVGVKMLLVSHFHVPNLVSLGIILGTLAGGVVASLWAARRGGASDGCANAGSGRTHGRRSGGRPAGIARPVSARLRSSLCRKP